MSFTYGFYNAISDDRLYNSVEISQLFDGLIRDGIYATIGTSMIVKKSTEANKVLVGIGRAWFNHTWSYNDSEMLLTGPESDLFLNRWDMVVLDIFSSDDGRKNDILWITGAPATNPVKPTLIKEPGHYQYPLAYIYRKVNTSIINQEDITNMVGSSETPFVTGILDALDIDNLLLQWRDQWVQFILNYEQTAVEWTNTQKTGFENYVKEFEAEMNAWLQEMKDALGETPATNLQNQINAIMQEMSGFSESINTRFNTVEATIGSGNFSTGDDNATAAINKLWAGAKKFGIYYAGVVNNTDSINGYVEGFAKVCRDITLDPRYPNWNDDAFIFVFMICGGAPVWIQLTIYKSGTSTARYGIGQFFTIHWGRTYPGMMPVYAVYNYSTNVVDYWDSPIPSRENDVTRFKVMTQTQYNSTIKANNTLYIITG